MIININKPESMMVNGKAMRWTAINKDTGQEIPYAIAADDVAGWVEHYKLDDEGNLIIVNNEMVIMKTIAQIELIPHW